jgi:DNA-binding protein HU-beta
MPTDALGTMPDRAIRRRRQEESQMANITKTDLVGLVAEQSDLSAADAKRAVESTFEILAARVAAGDEVAIAGFGKFSVTERSARQGRNPQTGETIDIAASKAPKFSAASAFKGAVKG